ncbi:MAG: site-specific integrase, partial [Nitrospina sp.]|nr:site-specific integrase [Nitrospina sp.]
MAKRRFVSTKFPGIRFRQHATRKHGIQFDRYFVIYYRYDTKNHEEGVGWASNGWTLERVNGLLGQIKRNQRRGDGPKSLKEMREAEKAAEEAAKKEAALGERLSVTYGD